ncbi:hypothetical protein [Gluconobacter aidae]|uniref:Uncharacterized protein n=1 Tax=Gluconobacter aidae TaxID=2662454 RepID=A0A7X1VPT3_9PROT|nr:hypothetical protein [Gluconobacter aidae]MQR98665.1 hypothetical protein [Gluconobacter aidae]
MPAVAIHGVLKLLLHRANLTSNCQSKGKAMQKVQVARSLLGTALDLFIQDLDPISVHSLACGGCEIIEGLATHEQRNSFSSQMIDANPQLTLRNFRTQRGSIWNAFKHITQLDRKTLRDDKSILESFSDKENDAVLLTGWLDYAEYNKSLPKEAKVFILWFYSINKEHLDKELFETIIRNSEFLFPQINRKPRKEQKNILFDKCSEISDPFNAIKYLKGFNVISETIPLSSETQY